MKKPIIIALLVLMASSLFAQENTLYLVFELMRVEEGNGSAYLETEEFWSGIHKQRALADEIIGWDLWYLEPSGTEQGFQYMTVNLYSSMESMMSGMTLESLTAYAKKAYPKMSQPEIEAKLDATSSSRDLAVRLFLKDVDATDDDFDVKEGTVATLAWMMEEDPSYEKMESTIFKPLHQKSVNNGKMAGWSLERIMLPAGSERYASHVAINFFDDMSQYVKYWESGPGDVSDAESIAIQEGLKTRDMKSVSLAQLIMQVRK